VLGDAEDHLAKKKRITLAGGETVPQHVPHAFDPVPQRLALIEFGSNDAVLDNAFTMCQMSYVCLIGANVLQRNSALTSRRSFLSELLRSVLRTRTLIFLLHSLPLEEFGGERLHLR
jgi:hypothetical protein